MNIELNLTKGICCLESDAALKVKLMEVPML